MANYYNNALAEKMAPEKMTVGWPWRLFTFSFLILLSALVVYFGLSFGYKILLQDRIGEVNEDLDLLSQSVPQEQQEKLIGFYSQLANLENLLKKHLSSGKVFSLLERNTNQSVYFNSAELKTSDKRLALEGVAPSYQVFAQQLEAFNRVPEVEKVVVSESYAGGGKVNFRLFLILNGKIFLK